MSKQIIHDQTYHRHRRIRDMLAHYRSILDKKKDGVSIYSHEYAVNECVNKFYWTTSTVEQYIAKYSDFDFSEVLG